MQTIMYFKKDNKIDWEWAGEDHKKESYFSIKKSGDKKINKK